MRRKEKEITGKQEIEEIIKKPPVPRIALTDGDTPYIVPVCFGYRDGIIFIHGSSKG